MRMFVYSIEQQRKLDCFVTSLSLLV